MLAKLFGLWIIEHWLLQLRASANQQIATLIFGAWWKWSKCHLRHTRSSEQFALNLQETTDDLPTMATEQRTRVHLMALNLKLLSQ